MFRDTRSKTPSRTLQAWAVAVAVALLAGPAFAQGVDYSRFQRATLEDLGARLAPTVAADKLQGPARIGDKIYDRALSSWAVEVSYDGAIRPMSADEAAVVHNSLKGAPQGAAAAVYEQSMRFRADGKDYWLPVEGSMVPYFAKELKPGDKIDLYVLLSGGVLQDSGWEWLFMVIDFQKPQAQAR